MTQGQATTALAPFLFRHSSGKVAQPDYKNYSPNHNLKPVINQTLDSSEIPIKGTVMGARRNREDRSPSPSPRPRLTRSSADNVKAREFDFRRVQSQAAAGRQSGVGKEVAALDVDTPGAQEPNRRGVSSRYDLRGGGKTLTEPAGVTKSRSTGKSKAKNVYRGPGYQKKGASRTAKKGMECLICAEPQKDNQFPTPEQMDGCSHESNVCRSCIARHVETQIPANGKWQGVQCLDCQASLNKRQISNLVWMDEYERLEELAAQKARESHIRYRSCLSSTCDAGQIHWSYKSPIVTCKECGSRSCFNHRIPWHEGYSCDSYDDSHPDAQSTRTSEERLKSLAKKCPGKGCSFYVEKDGGCDSMYCNQCNQSWDWGKVKFENKGAKAMYRTRG
ncbi:hypothetical protein G7Y79_00059g091820 [Physcia stellaris]|nr:hypothetical protein G7Y79_00059g091820 [Physcia stellaris]